MANNAYIHMDAADYSASKYSYIDLGYVPTSTTNVDIIMKITNDSFNAGDTYLFGMNHSQNLWSPDGGFGARIRTGNSPSYYFEPTYGSHFKDYCWQMPINTDFTIRFDQIMVAGKFTMYADGVSVQQWDLGSLQNLSLFLFATNYSGGSSYNYAHPDEWVKEIKIYERSTLVRDYVPKTQNGVVGLKDKVQGVFYSPTGEGKMVMEGNSTPKIIPEPLPAYPKKQTVMFNCRAWEIKSAPIICPQPVPSGPPADEIWYTSSDSNIVSPNNTSQLPTIISNTYSDGKGIIKCAGDITSIGHAAFTGCSGLTSVTIGNSVTSIGESAFEECTGLTSVTIPNSVTNFGNWVFWDCSVLNNITYTGTIAQWNAITKGSDWHAGVPATVVHCTDGDVTL